MNVVTLRKTLDDYGFETEKVLDTLLDVCMKQHVSDHGVLAEDVPSYTGVLLSYHLIEKVSWNNLSLFKCTPRGKEIAQQLITERIPRTFEQLKKVDLEGSYLILKYLIYLLSQGKDTPSPRPELKLLSPLPIIQETASRVRSLLLENGLARKVHQFTASGPTKEVAITVPHLFDYFEPSYLEEERISAFEKGLESVSRRLNLFRVLYFYDPKAQRIYLRKLREHKLSLNDLSGILEEMKQKNLVTYSSNPLLFKIENGEAYKRFLKERVLSQILDEFSLHTAQSTQSAQTNPEAYALLAGFEEEFRTFLESALKNAEEKWEKRLPEDTLERLKERQNDARTKKKKVYPLLHYIDFPNYLSIILHRTSEFSNWEVFEPYFISIGWIKGRLIEMNEIRNDLAHPKPLEPLQYRKLQLYVEEIRERISQ